MSGIKRCAWITASLAALFGLQAPLCAVACLEASCELEAGSPERAAAAMDGMPCHGAATPEPAPAQPDADRTCTCMAALVSVGGDATALAQGMTLAGALPGAFAVLSPRHRPLELLRRPAERLPPPDILLLHSTLLI